MDKVNLLEQLRNYRLVRNADNIYVLKNGADESSLDRVFGLSTVTLTPDKESISNFAAMAYLYGLFGIEVSTFTAVPAGYIASFQKGKEFYGTFFSEPYYVTKDLIGLCDGMLKRYGTLLASSKTEEEQKAANEEINLLYAIRAELSNKDHSITDKALAISGLTKTSTMEENITSAISKMGKVNNENCELNDGILEDIITGSKAISADLELINKEVKKGRTVKSVIMELVEGKSFASLNETMDYVLALQHSKDTFDAIMNSFILDSGYHVYKGNVRRQDGAILNSQERVPLLMSILKRHNPSKSEEQLYADLVDVLNMCSTDYSADVVIDVMKAIRENNKEKIDEAIPVALNNSEEKRAFRNAVPGIFDVDREGRIQI